MSRREEHPSSGVSARTQLGYKKIHLSEVGNVIALLVVKPVLLEILLLWSW